MKKPTQYIVRLKALFHHRWAIPILAELHRSDGAKLVTLMHRLGSPRESIQRTLVALQKAKLVQRNPGHGHPLRPEYVLAARGKKIAEHCLHLMDVLQEMAVEKPGLKKWSMPMVFALGQQSYRFSELRNELPDVTNRALTLALKELVACGLVRRVVSEDYPPSVTYSLEIKARFINECLVDLARDAPR